MAPGEGAALPWPVAAPKGYTVPPASTIQYPDTDWVWAGPGAVVVVVVGPVEPTVVVVVAPAGPWQVSVPESSAVPAVSRNCHW